MARGANQPLRGAVTDGSGWIGWMACGMWRGRERERVCVCIFGGRLGCRNGGRGATRVNEWLLAVVCTVDSGECSEWAHIACDLGEMDAWRERWSIARVERGAQRVRACVSVVFEHRISKTGPRRRSLRSRQITISRSGHIRLYGCARGAPPAGPPTHRIAPTICAWRRRHAPTAPVTCR